MAIATRFIAWLTCGALACVAFLTALLSPLSPVMGIVALAAGVTATVIVRSLHPRASSSAARTAAALCFVFAALVLWITVLIEQDEGGIANGLVWQSTYLCGAGGLTAITGAAVLRGAASKTPSER